MIKRSTILLQAIIILIGVGALAFLLLEPLTEGRNAGATLFQVYFNDGFLACAYVASIAFFAGLYQAFKLIGFIRQNKIFSLDSVKALKIIKYCAMSLVGFAVAAEAYLFIVRPGDDIAGGVFMGLLIIFFSGVVVIIATLFEYLLQKVIDIKSNILNRFNNND